MKKDMETRYREILAPYGVDLADCAPVRFSAGDSILHQGFEREYLYFVVEGLIQVLAYTGDGKKLVLRYSAREGVLGDLELCLGMGEFHLSVIAETDILCLALPYRRAEELFHTDIKFANRIAYDMAKKAVRDTGQLIGNLGRGDQRLCAYLLQEAENGVFREPLTETAAVLGLSYRHLLRMLAGLRAAGLIEKRRDGYHILDQGALAARL